MNIFKERKATERLWAGEYFFKAQKEKIKTDIDF